MNAPSQTTLCPRCLQADRVENVSALATARTHPTPLSLQLTRPPTPRYQSSWGWTSRILFLIGFALGIASLRFSLFFLVGLMAFSANNVSITSHQWTTTLEATALTIVTLGGAIAILVLKARQAKARHDLLESELSRWRQGNTRWHDLHFCSWDEVIFFPGTSEAYSPSDMTKLLYGS